MSSKPFPTLDLERRLAAGGSKWIIGIDEVGRGAIAGPVAVGVVVISPECFETQWPETLQDSKLLSEVKREALFEPLSAWVSSWAVGLTSAEEIDKHGISLALRSAASQALGKVAVSGASSIILDGSHNWLDPDATGGAKILLQTKADQTCVSVAAASVLAKVIRDRLMVQLASDARFTEYGFESHKGYAATSHIDALKRIGPSSEHRKTWLGKILQTDGLF